MEDLKGRRGRFKEVAEGSVSRKRDRVFVRITSSAASSFREELVESEEYFAF